MQILGLAIQRRVFDANFQLFANLKTTYPGYPAIGVLGRREATTTTATN